MTINEIYSKYQIPINLQQHMLRVTGLAKLIASRWNENTINIDLLTSACLTHDLGNLLKFDLVNKANFLGKDELNLEHWKKVKEIMIKKYGTDEHHATSEICKEIGLNNKSLWIVQNWGFGNFEKVLNSENWVYKIGVYSDHRIGPFDVVSLKDRFDEQKKRYALQKHSSGDLSAHLSEKSDFLIDCAFQVERQIQNKTKINLNSISLKDISSHFDSFLKFEI